MPFKSLGTIILTLGPAAILILFFERTLNNYDWKSLWLPMLVLFGLVVPLLGGLAIDVPSWRQSLLTALIYFPAAVAAAFLYSLAHMLFDPVPPGASEAALMIFLGFFVPSAIVGTVVALVSTCLGLSARWAWRRLNARSSNKNRKRPADEIPD